MDTEFIITEEFIMSKILLIRNQKVMIDSDLATLYGVTTKQLNQQVKRNTKRFPNNFMFQLTAIEKEQVVANCDHLNKLKFSSTLPYVFTEHGTMMLGNILTSDRAIEFSIKIVEAFIKMREFLTNNLSVKLEIEDIKKKLINHDKNIELVFNYLDELIDKNENRIERTKIGYKN
ncbi:ORF6N domain-containing protein [Flavobacterium restrictum]|uniref:ORF6N domain-containing protein n=1 Tax=Flavobacterium restrictum TaxID=2594428 RepID=A0A553DY42_9FLAO|nr:ORF6N domain-containing protein [Flavobacterium restrictum]TRX37724.1 ORF6N domain-containing protein [Flavobacterium restrictum]